MRLRLATLAGCDPVPRHRLTPTEWHTRDVRINP